MVYLKESVYVNLSDLVESFAISVIFQYIDATEWLNVTSEWQSKTQHTNKYYKSKTLQSNEMPSLIAIYSYTPSINRTFFGCHLADFIQK